MRIRTLLATALLVLATAACGGNGAKPSAAPSTTDRNAQAVRYSQCMRENGVPDFPDPVDGRIQLRAEKGSDLDPESAGFKKAQETCSLLPASLHFGRYFSYVYLKSQWLAPCMMVCVRSSLSLGS